MTYFECDYQEGCAPEILERLQATNTEQTAGYGLDPHSEHARQLIMDACGIEERTEYTWRSGQTAGTVHFMVGGTQTNTVVINSVLRPHQGVLCADSGHVNVHETGAIEHCGHKVMALPTKDGKLTAAQVQNAIFAHLYDPNIEHTVQPGMVYLSFPTETGLLYSKSELQDISAICGLHGLPLYIDGARMGYGLASPETDMRMEDFAQLADIFYIGGTKQGALFGEALVIANPELRKDFRYMIKQGGGMLAKGRLLGIQFETLFTDGLYMRLAQHAVSEALRIRQALENKKYELPWKSPTNQQFAVIGNRKLEKLGKDFVLSEVSRPDKGHTLVRICTSWATRKEQTDMLIAAL